VLPYARGSPDAEIIPERKERRYMVDPATVLVDPETLSADDLRQMLASQSLETVRWVVVSTQQTLDDVHRDVFADRSLFDGLNITPDLERLGAEVAQTGGDLNKLRIDLDVAINQQPATAIAANADASEWKEPLPEHVSLKGRAARLVKRSSELVFRTEQTLRTAGREAIERARHQSVQIVHNLTAAGSYALRMASSSKARWAMKAITAVVLIGAVGMQGIADVASMSDVAGDIGNALGAIVAVQDLIPAREKAQGVEDAHETGTSSNAQPSGFIRDLLSLKQLHDDGILTDQEFSLAKQRALAIPGPCP
jgi:hypothetical protein